MALKQITVLVNNRQGALVDITEKLGTRGVNIRALSIADTERFGILRMIVSDNEAAIEAVRDLGCLVQETEVVGVKIGDAPGKLSGALKVLSDAGINIEYLYAFCLRTVRHAYMVLRVADNLRAEKALEDAGYHIITDADVRKL